MTEPLRIKKRRFHGLKLDVEETDFGPNISRNNYFDFSFIDLMYPAIYHQIPDVLNRIEQGLDIWFKPLLGVFGGFVRVPMDPQNYDEERAARKAKEVWEKLTGREPTGLIYRFSLPFHSGFYIPQDTLYHIVATFQKERAKAQREAIKKHPAPWLFTENPMNREPAPLVEGRLLEALEDQLPGVEYMSHPDEADYQKAGPSGPAVQKARKIRADAYREMKKYGLFDVNKIPYFDARYVWLQRWGFTHLAEYTRAIAYVQKYIFGGGHDMPRRGSHVPPLEGETLEHNRLSLDWFRWENQGPEGLTSWEWTAQCEKLLLEATERGECTGLRGRFVTAYGGSNVRIHWQLEEGDHPRLAKARFVK